MESSSVWPCPEKFGGSSLLPRSMSWRGRIELLSTVERCGQVPRDCPGGFLVFPFGGFAGFGPGT